MKHVEFLEFLGRLAYEYFKDTDESGPLHIKIDKLLTPLLKLVHMPKLFTYLVSNKD